MTIENVIDKSWFWYIYLMTITVHKALWIHTLTEWKEYLKKETWQEGIVLIWQGNLELFLHSNF